MSGPSENERRARWRVVLGPDAEAHGVTLGDDPEAAALDGVLSVVFDADDVPGVTAQDRDGWTVPRWLAAVDTLFPREIKEVLQAALLRRRGIEAVLADPTCPDHVEPSVGLAVALLAHRDLLDEGQRATARALIQRVVEALRQTLQLTVQDALTGALQRSRHRPRRVFRNLDLRTTLRRNLHRWDATRQRLIVERAWYHATERNQRPWHVVVCVDQSGSMLPSALYSAVMASIFAGIPRLRTSLVLFDTRVVDLSDHVDRPVDVLLQLQLGGGTQIARALDYCASLIREPRRTLCVLVTDFYEGGSDRALVRQVRRLAQSGVRMIGVGALGLDARPQLHEPTVQRCREAGMDVLVCTPARLAEAMADVIAGSGGSRTARTVKGGSGSVR